MINKIKAELKRILSIAICLLFSSTCWAQVPALMEFHAMLRDTSGNAYSLKRIGVEFLIADTISNQVYFNEQHSIVTDSFGNLHVIIGSNKGNALVDSVPWQKGDLALIVGIDTSGSSNYIPLILSPFMSVPFSFYSHSAVRLTGVIAESDPFFKNSVAFGISIIDTSLWSRKLLNYTEIDSVFSNSTAFGIIPNDTAYWNKKQNKLYASKGIALDNDSVKFVSRKGRSERSIGELYGGGVVVGIWYDSLDNEVILISTTKPVFYGTDSSMSIFSDGSGRFGKDILSMNDGYKNSLAIVNDSGHSKSAAAICLNYSSGGYSDWYLPANNELNLIIDAHRLNPVFKDNSKNDPDYMQILIWSSTAGQGVALANTVLSNSTSWFAYQYAQPFFAVRREIRPMR